MNDNTKKEFLKELKDVLEKYNVSMYCDIDGDTHSLITDFIIETNERKPTEILRLEGETGIESHDLK